MRCSYDVNGPSLSMNNWHHLVGVREGYYIRFYVNGTLANSTFVGSASINNVANQHMLIGRTGAGNYTNAGFDELSIYNRALSAAEVGELFGLGCGDFDVAGEELVEGYRYGFNGKEKDDEVSGKGNQYDYGFRIYNPRLAKFLSVDPLTTNYPWYTPYQFAGNKPIVAIDLDGLEELVVIRWFDDDGIYTGSTLFKIVNANQRDVGKRQGGDQQTIELNQSLRASLEGDFNSSDISPKYGILRNEDGTFKGKYLESREKIHNTQFGVIEEKLGQGESNVFGNREVQTDNVLFEYDGTAIRAALSQKEIGQIKAKMDNDPDRLIQITGYASEENETGDADYNNKLSINRANAIKDILVKNGVSEDRIISVSGAGATTDFGSNKESNRRVVVTYTYGQETEDGN